MMLNSKTITGLPVRTRAGMPLGKAQSLDIDVETGKLARVHVKTRGIVPGLLDQELVVSWDQIVEITDKEIVVLDNTVPAGGSQLAVATEMSAGMHLSQRDVESGATEA